ncbi:MAG TPA: ATP-binding protein [Opitutales bacterium]|jgi:two-component system, sporulation sensor kinase E|nr:ATP-binding protein [Opitutales bacterium]
MARHGNPLERILGRIDDLDPGNLAILAQRLAREREMLETVFNTIKDGILVVDRESVIQYANAAACALVGLKERDVGVAQLWKVMPELARALDFTPRSASEARPARSLTRELEISYPERRHVRLYFVPLAADRKRGIEGQSAIILSDITEEQRSTRELVESERHDSVVMLAAGVAHELGNPLNSMNIHLQLIERQLAKLKESATAKKIKESADICVAEVERLDGIIRNFLEAIRPQPPNLVEVDLVALLAEVLALQEQELKNLGIRVEVEVAQAPVILADRNQVKQVFFNLIKNAMEAMERGGRLRIAARADDAWLYLAFTDSGVGIAQADLPRVFQPYFSTKRGGHGLGMMIIQRILRAHGGQIALESTVGRGTTVTLQFPLKDRRVRLLEAGA